MGDKARDDMFLNLRAELYRQLKQWIERGGQLYNKADREKELKALKYKRNQRGKIQMMSKDIIRKQYGLSPDTFDALMLTFYVELVQRKKILKRPARQYDPITKERLQTRKR